jgi:hypothetical protein
MKRPELVTATQAELDEILQRTKAVLPEHQYKVLEGVFRTFAFVMVRLQDAKASVGRLRRMLFGARTESLRNVIGAAGIEDANVVKDDEPSDGTVEQPHESADGVLDVASSAAPDIKKKRKGHGRNGADALRGATIVECCHEQLRSGQRCPQCGSGRVYDSAPGTVVRFSGQPPVAATVYRLQRLRCRLCDSVYAAEVPAGVSEASKYDASCASMLALLRYGSGMPFYRLQGLQASLHVPLPDATQWDIVKQAVDVPGLVHEELIRQAAQAELLHNDDTPARVLALMRERRQAEAAGRATPRAINTSGIVALLGAHRVVLFFTGHAHAGQNLQDVLARRAQQLPAPMQMCDALAANMAGDFATVLCHCLAHGRRKVVDVLEHFPEQGRQILEVLARVYAHDEHCREAKLSPGQRLAYHQRHSAELMQGLRTWMTEQLEQRPSRTQLGSGPGHQLPAQALAAADAVPAPRGRAAGQHGVRARAEESDPAPQEFAVLQDRRGRARGRHLHERDLHLRGVRGQRVRVSAGAAAQRPAREGRCGAVAAVELSRAARAGSGRCGIGRVRQLPPVRRGLHPRGVTSHEQRLQLACQQRVRRRAGARPAGKTPAGQPLGAQPEPLAVIDQDPHGRAPAVGEDEQRAGEGVGLQALAADAGQCVDARAKINRLHGHEDPHVRGELDHARQNSRHRPARIDSPLPASSTLIVAPVALRSSTTHSRADGAAAAGIALPSSSTKCLPGAGARTSAGRRMRSRRRSTSSCNRCATCGAPCL